MKLKHTERNRDPERYIRRLKGKLEEVNTREALIHFKHKVMERQKVNNHSGEYERIRELILQHSTLPFETVKRLKDRESEFKKKLGASR